MPKRVVPFSPKRTPLRPAIPLLPIDTDDVTEEDDQPIAVVSIDWKKKAQEAEDREEKLMAKFVKVETSEKELAVEVSEARGLHEKMRKSNLELGAMVLRLEKHGARMDKENAQLRKEKEELAEKTDQCFKDFLAAEKLFKEEHARACDTHQKHTEDLHSEIAQLKKEKAALEHKLGVSYCENDRLTARLAPMDALFASWNAAAAPKKD